MIFYTQPYRFPNKFTTDVVNLFFMTRVDSA